jgi:hypothetical protein
MFSRPVSSRAFQKSRATCRNSCESDRSMNLESVFRKHKKHIHIHRLKDQTVLPCKRIATVVWKICYQGFGCFVMMLALGTLNSESRTLIAQN